MAIGISVSRVVVIESLRPSEVRTGALQADWIRTLVSDNDLGVGVDLVSVPGAAGFRRVIQELAVRARTSGDWPILHIECHGSKSTGLWFADGTLVPWEGLGLLFTELNVASQFNLLVLVSACYGAHLTGQFSPVKPAPAWGIIAPTHAIDPAEILAGLRTFYARFAKTSDLGVAASELSRLGLSEGNWFSKRAEEWYEQLIGVYVRKRCTPNAIRHWARTLSHKMRAAGIPASVRTLERDLAARNASDLTGKYFDRFFCVADVPGNAERFRSVRQRVRDEIDTLRATGRFAL
jgi:hypothetical protein